MTAELCHEGAGDSFSGADKRGVQPDSVRVSGATVSDLTQGPPLHDAPAAMAFAAVHAPFQAGGGLKSVWMAPGVVPGCPLELAVMVDGNAQVPVGGSHEQLGQSSGGMSRSV